jgi:mannose-6-phosphate isomerase
MTPKDLYPLLFKPTYKEYVWGGNRIPRLYNRTGHPYTCAESWEISDRPEGMSVVSTGPLSGKSLHDLVTTFSEHLIGYPRSTSAAADSHPAAFPLLTKIIDAKQRLSLQVHPDNRTAETCGGEPKTEMWYVLDAEPGARIFSGLKPGVDRKTFEQALNEQRLENVLRSIPATSGTIVFVPGGRVHAIGEGCLLLEIQQNSNTTYRVYDWGRVGKDGNPRELHIAQALKTINWTDTAGPAREPVRIRESETGTLWEIVDCAFFRVTRLDLRTSETVNNDGTSFNALFACAGKINIEEGGRTTTISAGTSCLIPAAVKNYRLTPMDGDDATVICTSLH